MKALSVRLSEPLAAEIEAESRERQISKSEVVRERLREPAPRAKAALLEITDLIGSVQGLPADLSVRQKRYLKVASSLEQDAQSIERVGKWRRAVGAAARESRAALRDFRPYSRLDR